MVQQRDGRCDWPQHKARCNRATPFGHLRHRSHTCRPCRSRIPVDCVAVSSQLQELLDLLLAEALGQAKGVPGKQAGTLRDPYHVHAGSGTPATTRKPPFNAHPMCRCRAQGSTQQCLAGFAKLRTACSIGGWVLVMDPG